MQGLFLVGSPHLTPVRVCARNNIRVRYGMESIDPILRYRLSETYLYDMQHLQRSPPPADSLIGEDDVSICVLIRAASTPLESQDPKRTRAKNRVLSIMRFHDVRRKHDSQQSPRQEQPSFSPYCVFRLGGIPSRLRILRVLTYMLCL